MGRNTQVGIDRDERCRETGRRKMTGTERQGERTRERNNRGVNKGRTSFQREAASERSEANKRRRDGRGR